ncbi:MAG: hypothetical protein K8I27_00385 [Planctomycetes bacterium]|nr:hypothetical protein [Planctomycetota bacterium]
MSIYKLTNLETNTPKKEQEKLSSALNKLSGVTSSKLSPERKEFSLECFGVAPSFDAVKSACTGAGFQLQPQADKQPQGQQQK